jgi:hypothetical protein
MAETRVMLGGTLLVLHPHAIDSPTVSVAGATATELTDSSKLPHKGTASWGMMRMRSGMSHSSVASNGSANYQSKGNGLRAGMQRGRFPFHQRASRRRAPRRNGLSLAGRAILLNWFSRDTAVTGVYFCHSSDTRGTNLFVTLLGPVVR